VTVGPGVEIKSSFIGAKTTLTHLNFIGNSIIGRDVNIEAGAVIAIIATSGRTSRSHCARRPGDHREWHEIRGGDRRPLPDRCECRSPARNDSEARHRRRPAELVDQEPKVHVRR